MNAAVQWTGDMRFIATADSGHALVIDTNAEHGGHNSASSPMEMVLMGLAGCSAIDVLHILKKKRLQPEAMEIRLEAGRRENHPRVFSDVHLEFRFAGSGLTVKALTTAVKLSMEKYCSVAGMVSQTAAIHWDVVLVEGETRE